MSAAFSFRTATIEDAPALRLLIEQSVRVLSKDDYTAEQMEGAIHNVLGLDTQLIADETYFVAIATDCSNEIAGCGGWSFRKTLFGSDHASHREIALLDPSTDAAKIRAIFVHPHWARRGLGSLILQHCENAASHAGFSRLEMGSTLTGAALYARKGYQENERLKVSLPNGSTFPVIRMVKTL